MAAVEQSAYETFRGGTEVDTMEMDNKIKGAHLRGRKYTVSQDGLCPRCGNSNRLYVILDKLFPMGDMPEILHTLIAKGRAILWSSQEKEGYRDPPTLLCRGFCPPDPLGAGFNINWGNVSLNQILESLNRPFQKAINPVSSLDESSVQGSSHEESSDNSIHVLDEFRGEKSEDDGNPTQTSVMQSSSDHEEETEEDDDDDELDEEELIKQMLAKEQQKLSQENNHDDDNENDDDDDDDDVEENDNNEEVEASSAPLMSEGIPKHTSSSSDTISSTTVTASTAETSSSTTEKKTSSIPDSYPVSSTGRCPYCGASDVKYIIMVSENTKDYELPKTLQQLLKSNHAFKMAKGESEPPSFQCQKCQFGFNLNWSKTNLEEIFGVQTVISTASATTTASMPYQTPHASYMMPAAYPPYPRASMPPPGYPPPVGVPPPVHYTGYPPAYPSYYGAYYSPPPIPPPVGSYPPFSPTVPPPRIPPPGIRPPGFPPPRTPPPGVPPPAILPPGIAPPRVPPPTITPPGVPPPGVPPPGVPPPGVSPPGIPPPRVPPPIITPPGVPPPGIPPPGVPPPRIPPPRVTPPTITPPGVPPPRIPPPGVPPPGVPPPRIPPPRVTPPRIPPPGVPPPRIPPPGVPPPGIPPPGIPPPRTPAPAIPPPGMPPPRYPPPSVPTIPPPTSAWGSSLYTRPMYQTPPRYPPPTTAGYIPPPAVKPYQPPPQQVRSPHPWYQPPVSSGMSVPAAAAAAAVLTQQESSVEQTEEGENTKQAAARFEMVLNQIDLAKARVRKEKELMKEFQKEVPGATVADTEMSYQHYSEEPNALTDEGQKMLEYEERPPGDEDTGFESVVITESLEQVKMAENTSAAEQPVSTPQPMPVDITENTDVLRENDAATNVVETAVIESGQDTKKHQGDDDDVENDLPEMTQPKETDDDDDIENDLPETVQTSPKETVPTRAGRSTRSRKQDKSPNAPAAPARQTRRSRRSEPVDSTEDTESTAAEEDAAETARSRRSRKTRPPSRGVKKLDIAEDKELLAASDTEMGESSDFLSQSSAVPPETESDSQEMLSESLPSSSETETAAISSITRPAARGRATRGRKRKQASLGASARKSRRVVVEEAMTEQREECEEVEDEKMIVESPVVSSQDKDTEMTTTSPKAEESESAVMDVNLSNRDVESTCEDTNVDQTEEETVAQAPAKPGAATPISSAGRRQTRKSGQIPQGPDESTSKDEDVDQEVSQTTGNRRTRKSTPRQMPQATQKTASRRQTRKSQQLQSQASGTSDAEEQIEQTPDSEMLEDEVITEQKEVTSDTSQLDEGKTNRRTRKSRNSSVSTEDASASTRKSSVSIEDVSVTTRKSSVSVEDTSASTRVDEHSSQEPDALIATEKPAGSRQTRSSTPQTRKTRRSLTSNDDTTTEDVSVEASTPEQVVSTRRTRRNKSTPVAQETTEISQESDNMTAEADIEEEESITPQRRASRKAAPADTTATVTKRVTRNRQKK